MDLHKRYSRILVYCLVLAACFLLSSCHTSRSAHQTSIQQTESTLEASIKNNEELYKPRPKRKPPKVNNALLPPLSRYINPAREAPPRFDVTANKIPAKEFFMGLITDTKYNMVISPDISGDISLKLKNVTIQQAMDAVRDMYGYEYQQTSYGFEVSPPKLRTRLFHINYLDVQRTGKSYTQLTTGQVSNKVGTVTVGNNSGYSTTVNQPSSNAPEGLGTISSIETKSEM